MNNYSRIKVFEKIAGDFETLTDQAATRGMSQQSREEYERIMYYPSHEKLTGLEVALGFIPVVGESMALYSGCHMLLTASSKWDYLLGGLMITLGLFGLYSISGGKAGIQAAIAAAKKGEYSSLSKICAKLKVGSYADDILAKLKQYPDIDPNKIKTAITSVDQNAAALEREAAMATRETESAATATRGAESASREGAEQSAQAARVTTSWIHFAVENCRVFFPHGTNQSVIDAGLMTVKRAAGSLKERKLGNLLYNDIIFLEKEELKRVAIGDIECSGSVGGYYMIDDDSHIAIGIHKLSDITQSTKHLLHEIGHRYWYRFMNEAQRKAFAAKSFVRNLRPGAERGLENTEMVGWMQQIPMIPGNRFNLFKLSKFKETFSQRIDFNLSLCESAGYDLEEVKVFFGEFKSALNSPVLKTIKRINPDAVKQWESAVEKGPEILEWMTKNFENFSPKEGLEKAAKDFKDFLSSFPEQQVDDLLSQLVKKPGQSTKSVSSYGSTNIEESFAESFGHFFSGMSEMTQEQIRAFKEAINLERIILNSYNGNHLIKLAEDYLYFANLFESTVF